MIEAREIDVALCRASPMARLLDHGHVVALAESIKANAGGGPLQNGLRQPINVRPVDDGYEIRGGYHRVAAFRHLGLRMIPCLLFASMTMSTLSLPRSTKILFATIFRQPSERQRLRGVRRSTRNCTPKRPTVAIENQVAKLAT